MIEEGNFEIAGKTYDRKICPSDWRFSATIVGLYRYFKTMGISFSKDKAYLYYNYNSVNNEADDIYAEFLEKYYGENLHHVALEILISKKDKSEEDLKLIKEKLIANVPMKNTFGGIKANQEDEILSLIEENRYELARETFKNAMYGYRKYANTYKFRNERDKVCRLNGYCVDTGRKTRSISFSFDEKSRVFNDCIEFDFIPFAFTRNRESIFVNNNYSVDRLIKTNENIINTIQGNEDFRQRIFFSFQEGAEYIDYDVEIIIKDQDKDFYETMFVRKEAIEIFRWARELNDKNDYINKALSKNVKIYGDNYLNVMKEVTDRVLNLNVLDDLILILFKLDPPQGFKISQLVKINRLIFRQNYFKGGNAMDEIKKQENFLYYNASESAKAVKIYFDRKNIKHKLDAYRNKLITALAARDSRRVSDIMLQLSSYAQVDFKFMHAIFKDFDKNINVLYDFTNQLNYFERKEEDKDEE